MLVIYRRHHPNPFENPYLGMNMFLLFVLNAMALTLNLQSESNPYPGIVVQQYLTTSPSTKVTVVSVDLCASGIHLDATVQRDWLQTTGSWANQVGVQVAMNGDFFTYGGGGNGYDGPPRVYGNAVGNGQPWPVINTGTHSDYSVDWYYHRYGWIAFAHDRIYYTYPEWVKLNPSVFSNPIGGWQPTTVNPAIPPGTLAMISGFSALVVEGEKIPCNDPTDSSCFPYRSDMADARLRSAVGFTEDRQTLLMVAVGANGQTGMRGAELSELMWQLGAYFALNIDGGGSSQLWSNGYINFPSEYYRTVANHLGVYAGSASGMPSRPGHCESSTPCQVIPPEGGIIDNESDCFHAFGDAAYWRNENQGHDGSLIWTNAFVSSSSYNWARWQINMEIGGEYEVEYYATPAFSVFDEVAHTLWADGIQYDFTVDQSVGSGWTSMGTYQFSTGGEQSLSLYDNGSGSIGSNQHVVADAIRLTRIGGWCGDGACLDGEDCSSCSEDCTGESEIPRNEIDDDCDGATDHSLECDGVITEILCVSDMVLGICNEGFYSEFSCGDIGKVCSPNLLQCIDSTCLDRENERWCDGTLVMECTAGELNSFACPDDCIDGECWTITDSGDVSEPSSDDNDEAEEEGSTKPKSSCSTGGSFQNGLSWLFLMVVFLRFMRTEKKEEELSERF